MFRIRPNCFETNSSSMDRYDDYDDNLIKHTTAHQKVRIILNWNENTNEFRINEIMANIINGEINKELFEQFDDFYDDPEGEVYDCDEGNICLNYLVTIGISYNGKFYPATRTEPAEYPEPELDDDWEGVPLKNQEFPTKEKIKKNLMKVFHNKGWLEIIGIDNIYGEDIDEDEAFNNIRD